MSDDRETRKYWVGFDLGGTKMLAVVFDDRLREVARRRRKTRANEGEGVSLERIAETILQALELAKVLPAEVAGVGAGVPGPLDLQKGVVLEAPNLGWKNVGLQEFLAQRFNCPAVICNDVDAGVFGEYSAGSGQGYRGVLGVFPGTGIGGGFVYEGKIFRGSRSSCMEVGYMQMSADGPSAGAGPPGTLEGMASRLAISAEAAKAVFRGQAPHLKDLAGTDISNIRSSALAKSIERGDRAIEKIVRRAAEVVGQGDRFIDQCACSGCCDSGRWFGGSDAEAVFGQRADGDQPERVAIAGRLCAVEGQRVGRYSGGGWCGGVGSGSAGV